MWPEVVTILIGGQRPLTARAYLKNIRPARPRPSHPAMSRANRPPRRV
jgi:hypothetical protein